MAPLVPGAGERLFERAADVDLEPVTVCGNELVTHLTSRVLR